MREFNAAGTRVTTRPPWVIAMLTLATGGLYRIYWAWRTDTDLVAFGRTRTAEAAGPSINATPALSAVLVALAFPGWYLLYVGALPWGISFATEEYGGGFETSLESRLWYGFFAVALLAPAAITLLRIRGRIRTARMLAGLPRDTAWTRPALVVPALACEVALAPAWLFAAQHSVDDLWSHYPALLDEDLHGALAPPTRQASAVARRPALHELRLRRIADELERPSIRPWVTLGFAALCIAMYAIQVSLHGWFPTTGQIEEIGGLRTGLDGMWWRFWTANVLHLGVDHLVGNMLIWVVVATMVERVVGHARMVALIVIGAAACSAGGLYSEPDIVSVGASGVVFAAFGLAVLLDPFARRPVGRFGWLLALFGLGLSTFAPGVSAGGHVGGILGGAAFGVVVALVWRLPRVERTWSEADLLTPVLDRTAPLAPDRTLSTRERLAHLALRRDRGELDDSDYHRLAHALQARG